MVSKTYLKFFAFQYRFVWEKPSYTSGEDGRIAFEDEGVKSYCRVAAVQIQARRREIHGASRYISNIFRLFDRLRLPFNREGSQDQ